MDLSFKAKHALTPTVPDASLVSPFDSMSSIHRLCDCASSMSQGLGQLHRELSGSSTANHMSYSVAIASRGQGAYWHYGNLNGVTNRWGHREAFIVAGIPHDLATALADGHHATPRGLEPLVFMRIDPTTHEGIRFDVQGGFTTISKAQIIFDLRNNEHGQRWIDESDLRRVAFGMLRIFPNNTFCHLAGHLPQFLHQLAFGRNFEKIDSLKLQRDPSSVSRNEACSILNEAEIKAFRTVDVDKGEKFIRFICMNCDEQILESRVWALCIALSKNDVPRKEQINVIASKFTKFLDEATLTEERLYALFLEATK